MADESADAYYARLEREHAEQWRKDQETPGGRGSDAPAGDPILSPDVIDARSWHGTTRPVREFLDDRKWFRMGMVSNFSGPGGIGKTMAALQACVACSAGKPWLGREIRPGPAMFYSAEEPLEEIHTRVDEICEAEMLHLNEFPHPLEIVDTSWHPQAALIEAGQGKNGMVLSMTPMFHWLKARMLIVKPQVLFVDNRAQTIIGNENDRVVAGFAMRMLGALARDTGAAVVPLSHPSMSGSKTGASGSTQWFNTARSNVFMTRPGQEDDDSDLADLSGDDGRRVLKNNKSNYGPLDSEANVVWEMGRWRCTDEPKPDSGLDRIGQSVKCERVFMDLMRWHGDRDIDLSHNSRAQNYAPKMFNNMPKHQREGFNETWFTKAMTALFDQQKIKLVEKRKRYRQMQVLVIA